MPVAVPRRTVAANRPVAEATATNGAERQKARPRAGLFAAVLAVAMTESASP
jgi:hypothetical protein